MNNVDITLSILGNLGVGPTTSQSNAPLSDFTSIDEECVRRAFWFIRFMDLTCAVRWRSSPLSFDTSKWEVAFPIEEAIFQSADCLARG